jgi:hypothetical protein
MPLSSKNLCTADKYITAVLGVTACPASLHDAKKASIHDSCHVSVDSLNLSNRYFQLFGMVRINVSVPIYSATTNHLFPQFRMSFFLCLDALNCNSISGRSLGVCRTMRSPTIPYLAGRLCSSF